MSRFWTIPLLTLFIILVVDRQQRAEIIEVRFTEILYDAPGLDDENEWFELANFGERLVDLSGFVVTDEEERGQREGAVSFPSGSVLEPNQVVVVAQNAVAFRERYGRYPDFEIKNSTALVSDMGEDSRWASGRLAFANDGDELILMAPDLMIVIDAIVYGREGDEILAAFELPTVPLVQTGQSIERIVPNCDTDSASDWQPVDAPSPGFIPLYGECLVAAPLHEGDWINIGKIQGRDQRSPYENSIVVFRGIVTGKMSDLNSRGVLFHSFFVQDESAQEDGDPRTSDGIAVFAGIERPRVELGDLVVVKGQVIEFFGLTEIGHSKLEVAILAHNQEPPNAVNLGLVYPDAPEELEPYESMLVSLDQGTVVGPTYAGCEFAVIPTASWSGPLIRHSLDDELQSAIGVRHKLDTPCESFPSVNAGDLVSGVSGPLTFSFGQYRVMQQDVYRLAVDQKRNVEISAAKPLSDDRDLRVATFNLSNYFDGTRDNSDADEPISSSYELEIRSDKLAYTIGSTLACPDILGIQEVENRELLSGLVDRLSDSCDFTYGIIHQDGPDGRGIDVALLVNLKKNSIESFSVHQTCSPIVTTVQDPSISCDSGEYPLFSRPPLGLELQSMGNPLVVFVNHFKSKREGELETKSRRLAEAEFLRKIIESRVREEPSVKVIVLGDFNDFLHSETAKTLLYGDILEFALGQIPPAELYSYNFSGISQLVDWILVSPSLIPKISNAEIFHVNADYAGALALSREAPYTGIRTSDHDIPLVDIRLDSSQHLTAPAAQISQTTGSIDDEPPGIVAPMEPDPPGKESPTGAPYKGILIVSFIVLIATVSGILWIRKSRI